MHSEFKSAAEFVLMWETGGDRSGAYTNNPDDPGGETKWGISKKAHPELDIANLTLNDAMQIYYVDYWKPMGCDEMSAEVALSIFDSAVNCGVHRTKVWMHQSRSLPEFLLLRFKHYTKLAVGKKENRQFLLGWMKRLAAVTERSLGSGLNETVIEWWS